MTKLLAFKNCSESKADAIASAKRHVDLARDLALDTENFKKAVLKFANP